MNETERVQLTETTEDVVITEIESRNVTPRRECNLVLLPIGKTVVIGARDYEVVQLPLKLSKLKELVPTGHVPSGIVVCQIWVLQNRSPRLTIINLNERPMQLGSRVTPVGFRVNDSSRVFWERTNGRISELQERLHISSVCNYEQAAQKIIRQHPLLFDSGGPLTAVTHYRVTKSGIDPNVEWKFVAMPYLSGPDVKLVEPHIKDLLRQRVIREVDFIPLVLTPLVIVPKRNGESRMVLDFRKLNTATKMPPCPPIDRKRLMDCLPRRDVWTTVDMRSGFLQIELSDDIQPYFGFHCNSRYYVYTRVPFGWQSSMNHFLNAVSLTIGNVRREMEQKGMDDVLEVYVDDILVGSKNVHEHQRVLKLLARHMIYHNWTVNAGKTCWFRRSIEFLGSSLTPSGVRPGNGLIRQLQELTMPVNRQELRSFLGLVLQLNKYCWRQDQLLEEISKWKTKKPNDFDSLEFKKTWSQTVYECSRRWMPLDYWSSNPRAKLSVVVDASSEGYGGALLCDDKPVALYSRRNSKGFAHSSDAELEAIVGCMRAFRHYLWCRPVTVKSDSWSAVCAMNPDNHSPTVQRRLFYLLQDHPQITFVSGIENELADLLSRERYFMQLPEGEVVQTVGYSLPDDVKTQIQQMHKHGHYGEDAMVELLKRSSFDSEDAREEARRVVRTCHSCQKWKRRFYHEEMHFLVADKVSDVIGIDALGPLSSPGAPVRYVVVIVDYCSRFMQARPHKKVTAEILIADINQWRKDHGTPRLIMSDSASVTKSNMFTSWCEKQHPPIKQRFSAPGHQASNGLVERSIGTLLGRIRRLKEDQDGRNWWQLLNQAVDAVNKTPNRVTHFSPSELRYGLTFFGGEMTSDEVKQSQLLAKERTQAYRTLVHQRREKDRLFLDLEIGDEVLMYRPNREAGSLHKLESPWKGPLIIEKKLGRAHYRLKGIASARFTAHGDDLLKYLRP